MKYNLQKVLTARTPEWLRAEVSDPATGEGVDRIYIDGIIGGGWFDEGTDAHEFRRVAEELRAPTLEVHINSPGGSVDEGIAIYSYLVNDPRKIVTVVDGMAASIASVILMAGDVIRINAAASVMVHKPWAVTVGNDAETRAASIELGNATTNLAKVYQARTGQTFSAVERLMKGEEGADGTVMNAEEAVRLGFADEIIPAKEGAPAIAALYADFFDAADPEKRKPCEGEEEKPEEEEQPVEAEAPKPDEEEKPETETEPDTPAAPSEPSPAPESPSEPGEAPDPAPEEEPEKEPEEETAEESSEVEEEQKPEEEVKAEAETPIPAPPPAPAPKALRPAPQVEAVPAVTDWEEAVKVCGSYASARRKYPKLYEDFMESHR